MRKSRLNTVVIVDMFVILYVLGIVFSKFLISVATVGLLITAMYKLVKRQEEFGPDIKPFLALTIIFWITIWSGLFSDDITMWTAFVMKKLPFLILPFSFYVLRNEMSERIGHYLMLFVAITVISGLGVVVNYFLNYDAIQSAIGRGQAMPTPIDHTEYSLYLAYGLFICAFGDKLMKQAYPVVGNKAIGLMALFLFLVLHILAVRSGLAVFYITSLIIGSYALVRQRKWLLLVAFLSMIFLIPIVAVNTIPSINNKWHYTKYDYLQYKKGNGVNYSDSQRLYSIKVGLDIASENLFNGTGIGDLSAMCKIKYKEMLGEELDHYPHNQYLFILASMGLIGLMAYLIALFYPFYYYRHKLNYLLVSLYLLLLVSGLVENTIERTFSIAFYLFFVLLIFTRISQKNRSWI